MQIDLPPDRYGDPVRMAAFVREALGRIAALPGVVAAGATRDLFTHRQPDYRITVEGRPAPEPGAPAPPLTEDAVYGDFFQVLEIPLIAGRLFTDRDREPDAPRVRIINQTMADRFWPGEDPIGKRLRYGTAPDSDQPWMTVVGVVGDARRRGLEETPIPNLYHPGGSLDLDVVVRAQSDPIALQSAIQREVRAIDDALPLYGVTTLEQRVGQSTQERRFQTALVTLFAALALILAAIGIYGVTHQSVSARRPELGIRTAFGARPRDLLRLVLGRGLVLAAIGVAAGSLGALALNRLLATLLYGVDAGDPLTAAGAASLLVGVALAACWLPARRAAAVDPVTALRCE
jgi:predicted permease